MTDHSIHDGDIDEDKVYHQNETPMESTTSQRFRRIHDEHDDGPFSPILPNEGISQFESSDSRIFRFRADRHMYVQ